VTAAGPTDGRLTDGRLTYGRLTYGRLTDGRLTDRTSDDPRVVPPMGKPAVRTSDQTARWRPVLPGAS
jgi:hypothetical protein